MSCRHTKEFWEKHNRLLERREKERQEKLIKKAEKRKNNHLVKLEKRREEYKKMKENLDEYKSYLDSMKIYRDKYKQERELEKMRIEKENDKYFASFAKITLKNRKGIYYIDKCGNLYNSKREKITHCKTKGGYLQATNQMVHRLVWEAFNGKIPEGMEIDHINCIRDDNRLENLRLVTHKENCNNPTSIENYRKHNKQVDRSYLRKKS